MTEQTPDATPPRPGPEPSPVELDLGDFFEVDRTPQRATTIWVLMLVLISGTVLLRGSPWQTGPTLHLVLEALNTLLAAIVGSLSLVRYYSKKRETYLFIGAGFLGTALLDGYHAIVSAGFLTGGRSAIELEDMTAWTWIGARLFLSLFLYASWLSLKWEERGEGDHRPATEVQVYATTLLTTGLILGFVTFLPTTRAYYPEFFVGRPADLVPAGFFLLALVGYLTKGHWRHDQFEYWLVIALLISAMSQAAYMPFSVQPHDAAYDASHFLKLTSYAAVLIGVMASVYVTFRREEEAVEHVRVANETLAQEVSVRRRAEQILIESEDRLRDFLENAHDLIQSTAPDGSLRYVNEAWCETLGHERDDVLGRELVEFVHPSYRDRWNEALQEVLRGEQLSSLEIGFVRGDSRVSICSGSLNARFEHGRPVVTRGIFRDVTTQRRIEQEVARSQANLEALIESTGDVIWSVDSEGALVAFNTAFSLSMEARTDREPRKGDRPHDLFSAETAQWYQEKYEEALSGERISVTRTEEIGSELRHMDLFFNPIVEEAHISGVVVFGRDVTRRVYTEEALRLAKEEAEAANRAKTHFLANMSHELRTPLNSVIGFTNILLKDKDRNLTEQQKKFMERILTNGRHLLELINDVLDLAKVESGRMELDITPVDLEELVGETLAQLEGQVRAQKGDRVKLRGEVPEDIRPLDTDRAKLKQVIINLVGNALKFTEEGEVAVIVEPDDLGSRPSTIHVRDTGIGIPDDRLEAIFEAFQQADSSTSRKYGGTGLGLAISRSICHMLGYDVGVSSVVGEGSTFSIHVESGRSGAVADSVGSTKEADDPVQSDGDSEAAVARRVSQAEDGNGAGDEADEADEADEEEPLRATANFKVLVIDDEPDSRLLMRHYLHDFGCKVFTAASGEEGLEVARRERPNLVTLDLVMSGMDGWETLQAFKEDPVLRTIPVVVVSIRASEDRGRLLGAMDLVNKPIEREDLLRVLWRNLPQRKGSQVLVVDDDPDARSLYRSMLEDAGLDVVTAENGSDALHVLGRSSPDLILLDLMMPVMDGMTFLEKLREIHEFVGLPVIVVTAKELDDKEREILGRQASGVLSKVEDDVRSLLEQYLDRILHLDGHR